MCYTHRYTIVFLGLVIPLNPFPIALRNIRNKSHWKRRPYVVANAACSLILTDDCWKRILHLRLCLHIYVPNACLLISANHYPIMNVSMCLSKTMNPISIEK